MGVFHETIVNFIKKNAEFKANADERIVHILAELAPSSVTRQGKGDSLPWTFYSSAYSKHASLLELQMPMSYLLTEKPTINIPSTIIGFQ